MSSTKLGPGLVYFVRAGEYTKIGRTADITRRIRELQVANPHKVVLDCAIVTSNPVYVERIMHRHFAPYRVRGEWYMIPRDYMRTLFWPHRCAPPQ